MVGLWWFAFWGVWHCSVLYVFPVKKSDVSVQLAAMLPTKQQDGQPQLQPATCTVNTQGSREATRQPLNNSKTWRPSLQITVQLYVSVWLSSMSHLNNCPIQSDILSLSCYTLDSGPC